MNITNVLYILLSIFFFCIGIAFSQVSVIQFNSEWNSDNSFDISVLDDCEKSDVVICHNADLQDKHHIKSVPTVIIFDNGNEITRFEANIMMELNATKEDIQSEIDRIYLAKFE